MSGIHNELMKFVRSELEKALIKNLPEDDKSRAGVVTLGPLQGDPDPDTARISVTMHENDPEAATGKEASGATSAWTDQIEEIEVGGITTWRRRFTVRARCLLANTQEGLDEARDIASTVRSRIEAALLSLRFSSVSTPDEYVSRGVFSDSLTGEMLQSGGPEAYDFHIKIRFEVLTTTKVSGV